MRKPDLPSLSLLPALEAAARLGSFKESAKELYLTPSAISQQIRTLERELGTALFVRDGRSVKPTREGELYAREVRHALNEIALATQRLRARADDRVLHIDTLDYIAYEFLLPRLTQFRQRFPGIELRTQTSVSLVDLRTSDVDLVIRVGGGPWPSCHTAPFGRVTAAVVTSPALARKLRKHAQVLDHPLLEVRGQEHRGWRAVLERIGKSAREVTVLTFESYFETLRAAEQGLGIAFGLFPLATEWVLAGRLAVPFAERVPIPGHAALLSRVAEARRPLYREFLAWLREQFEALPAVPDGRIVPTAQRAR